MSSEKTGAIISRGVGLGLIIMGASGLLALVQTAGPATSGWTSYSPDLGTTTTKDLGASLQSVYYSVSNLAIVYLPSAAQAVGGFVMILLSRPIGRWLARGLSDGDDGN